MYVTFALTRASNLTTFCYAVVKCYGVVGDYAVVSSLQHQFDIPRDIALTRRFVNYMQLLFDTC